MEGNPRTTDGGGGGPERKLRAGGTTRMKATGSVSALAARLLRELGSRCPSQCMRGLGDGLRVGYRHLARGKVSWVGSWAGCADCGHGGGDQSMTMSMLRGIWVLQAPMKNPYDRDTASPRATPLPRPTASPVDDLAAPADGAGEDDKPVSVHARPFPRPAHGFRPREVSHSQLSLLPSFLPLALGSRSSTTSSSIRPPSRRRFRCKIRPPKWQSAAEALVTFTRAVTSRPRRTLVFHPTVLDA
ncbi:hypothetical protein B0H13DRAFT_2345066 [Mycena leptocephala]|nr:hypothetical protein B0H13DRAFT_2345066 [Mycena leptocephala]